MMERLNIQNSRRPYPVWESSLQSLRVRARSWIKRSRTNIRRFSKEGKNGTSWGTRSDICFRINVPSRRCGVSVIWVSLSAVEWNFLIELCFCSTRLEERNIQTSYASKLKRKNQLLASRSNKLKRSGDHVPDLLGSIAEAYATGRFLKRPVGPIGDFLFSCFVGLTSCLHYRSD